jgi:hypothetical protein
MIQINELVDRILIILREDRFSREELEVIKKTFEAALKGTENVIARAKGET